MITYRNLSLSLLCAAFAACCSTAQGQQFTGEVADQSGARLPKAVLEILNVDTGLVIRTTTTSAGTYTVPYLTPGHYSVTVEKAGFKTNVRTDIKLETGQTATINFKLDIGSSTDTVTVKSTVLLDASTADRGEVTENTRITELPLNGRDPGMLSILSAGANWTGSLQWQRPFDDTQQNLSINGGSAGSNQLMLDGTSNESGRTNSLIAYVPPVDAVQEFKIIINPYDAQYGRAGGGVQDVTLKTGTNTLHGDVYEFARRTWLDANGWQNNYLLGQTGDKASYGRPQHKLDQYGLELDGPVYVPKIYDGHNKSFFLLQYENLRETLPSTIVTSVPDPAWINGDFSNLTYWNGSTYSPITIYDPLTIHKDSSGNYVRDPFPGNKIPASRMNATAQRIMSYYPKPNLTPTAGTNPFASNYGIANPETDRYRNVLGKWDQNVSAADRVTLRYGYWERISTESVNGMPGPAASGAFPHGERSHTFAVNWVHTFSPKLLFDFRSSVNTRADFWSSGPTGFDQTSLGWSASQVQQFATSGANHFPKVSVSEFATLGSYGLLQEVENGLNIFPSLTWIHAKHSIHAGIDLRLLQEANTSVQEGPYLRTARSWTQSDYNADNGNDYSGNSFASLLLGTLSSGSTSINPLGFWSRHYFAPFVQDDWKASRKLTLNLGIRWDLNGPTAERHNRSTYGFDTTTLNPVGTGIDGALLSGGELKGGVTFAGVNGNPRSPYALQWTNIQPRVGVAYAATDRTVIRFGFGEMFMNPNVEGSQLGWSSTTPYTGTYDGGITPIDNLSNPFPVVVQPQGSSLGLLTNLGQSQSFINPHYKIPSFWTFSAGFEQQFGANDTLEVTYSGSRSFNQDSSDDINRENVSSVVACDVTHGGNRALCEDPLLGYQTNPFYGVSAFEGTSYYSATTVSKLQMSRPMPQFEGVTESQLNGGSSWYNSLQVTGTHRWHAGLTLHGTWTWSKTMDQGGFADTLYRVYSRTLDANDLTHRVTLSSVYDLPIGRGRTVLPELNRVVDTVVGGWELGALYIYQTGAPWSVPAGSIYRGSAWTPKTTSHDGIVRGVLPCVDLLDATSGVYTPTSVASAYGCKEANFLQQGSYEATQNVVYSGIRLPSSTQFDTNLSKNFGLHKRLTMQLRLEAFNVLNHPVWQVSYNSTLQSSEFGTFQKGATTDQSNLARQVQLAVKILW